MTRRRFIADEWTETAALLRNERAAHLARVLRAEPGQQFDIVAGDRVRRGVIESVDENLVEFSLHEPVAAAESLPLTIGLSLIRFERFEWAIEKLTELGVRQIVPLAAHRSEKHLVQAAAKRVERWRKIARESVQQSRRSDVPEIADPLPLSAWMEEPLIGQKILLSEQERTRSLKEQLQSSTYLYAAVGPEGGWTDRELAEFAKHDWLPATLGPRILRAETAAIAVASLAAALWL